jgi:hypothetical protein
VRERHPLKGYDPTMLLRGLVVGILFALVGVAAATHSWVVLAVAALALGASMRLIAPRHS